MCSCGTGTDSRGLHTHPHTYIPKKYKGTLIKVNDSLHRWQRELICDTYKNTNVALFPFLKIHTKVDPRITSPRAGDGKKEPQERGVEDVVWAWSIYRWAVKGGRSGVRDAGDDWACGWKAVVGSVWLTFCGVLRFTCFKSLRDFRRVLSFNQEVLKMSKF